MKKTTTIQEDDAVERAQEAAELAELNAAEDGDLFRVTDELRTTQGVECMVLRLSPAEHAGYCGMIPISEFSNETLKKRYGSGHYRIRIKGPKGLLPGGGSMKIADVPTGSPSSGPTDVLSMIELMDKRERERVAERNERNNRMLELGIPALATVVTAMLSRNQGPDIAALIAALKPAPGPTLTDLTIALTNMKTLNGDDSKKSDPVETLLKVMDAVRNMGEGNGGGNGSSSWVDVVRDLVKEAVPAIQPVLENLRAQQQQNAQRPPLQIARDTLPPAGAIAGTPMPTSLESVSAAENIIVPTAENSGDDMMALMIPLIRSNLAKVTQWAADDKNPATYAEVFLDDLPQYVASYVTPAQAVEYINHPQWWEKVCEFHPMIKVYKPWCKDFRQELLSLLQDQIDEAAQHSPQQITDPLNGEVGE